jgi:hypothetical protein
MVLGDVLTGSVPVVSCGDSAIVWPYIIRSLGEMVIKSLLKKYLCMISSLLSRLVQIIWHTSMTKEGLAVLHQCDTVP